MDAINWIYLFDMAGTAVFALTGALAAARHKMDPFGVIVLAAVTAVGGGSIRDALIGATPVFWLTDSNYIVCILLTVLPTILLVRYPNKIDPRLLPIADAFGLALFTIIGVEKSLAFGISGMGSIIMGVITGVGGGMIRDILCRKIPLILRSEIYATAAMLGAITYMGCYSLGLDNTATITLAMLVTLSIRLAAIHWHLSLPAFDGQTKRY
ncbi:trimeric intracellular cation channel family protein [Shewanella sp. SNU WT4]|uniref:trimeric intracellular cation channel family protein n=1 Tax=Shewanella sp. SNU WT4 TaxID=2590015 RepID=UPI001127FD81|nr:trimeric intracellular cation channel family protein [Shewanella sp. SNU WT4]QDF66288.1 trimeric intracellular cation channel family protein [Shewanella sp. SNU WT4]